MSKIGFLHTAQVHVEPFESLARAIRREIEVEHIVAPELLASAINEGLTDELRQGVAGALASLVEQGCQAITCTCSTLGSVAEDQLVQGVLVQRIDRAVADQAMKFDRLLVVAALESAAIAADELLESSAQKTGSPARWLVALVPGAWAYFEAGDLDAYHHAIAAFVNASASAYDAVFLSQASMQAAVPFCDQTNILTSPRLGVERLLNAL